MKAEIGFVQDDEMTLGESRRHFEALRGFKRLAGIEDLQNEIGTLQLTLGSLNADALDGILRIAKAGGIHEAQRNAMHLDDFLDRIPRGARGGTHDGTLKAEQEIEQTAFAHIRCSGDHRAGTVTQDATLLGGGEELAGMRLNGSRYGEEDPRRFRARCLRLESRCRPRCEPAPARASAAFGMLARPIAPPSCSFAARRASVLWA
jgi:hypothetical protein